MAGPFVVFDLDGVLIDSWQLMQKAFSLAYAESGGVGTAPMQAFRQQLGRPLARIAETLRLPETFIAAYESASRHHLMLSQPFAGVPEVLAELRSRDFSLALNTGKYRLRTEEILARFHLRSFFQVIITGDEVDNGKPHPESLQRVAKQFKAECSEMFFVGDMQVDILCAQAAGVTGVAALWGIGSPEELRLSGSCLTAETIYDVPDVLSRECAGRRPLQMR